MDKVVKVSDLWKCETCFHNQSTGCNTFCDAGESYRPTYSKLTVYEVDPKDLKEEDHGN